MASHEDRRVEDQVDEYVRRRWEVYWGGLRALSPGGWNVEVDWEGEEHLTAALRRGRGVILWFYSFCDNLIMLRALAEKGYTVTHLSRISHGAPSKSLVGLALLGGFARHAEGRHLAGRVVINKKLTPSSMRCLDQALAANHCVTFRGDQSGRPGVGATLFGHPVRVAPGAPSLAWKTGAALLTMGLYRKEFGRYGLRVGPPIKMNQTDDRKAAVRKAVSAYIERLQQQVELHPADWYGWEQDPKFWLETADGVATPLVTPE